MKPVNVPGPDKQWQAEQDLRTLAEAIEINKDSKRLAAAKALAKEKMADMAKIAK
jgi:hypothetical protein